MKLALYNPYLKGRGGVEKVLLEIMKKSKHEVTLFTLFYDEEKSFKDFKKLDVRILGGNKCDAGFAKKFLRFGLGSALMKIDLKEFDAFLVSEAGLGSLITLRNNDLPTICYCHTPLRVALPEFEETYKKEIGALQRPLYNLGIKFYNFLERKAWSNFDKIMANSRLTKERIVEKGLSTKERISVLNPGVDLEDFEGSDFENYFFYPSRFRRYKRQDLAIKAFKEANLDNFKLILAGSSDEEDFIEELRTEADKSIEILTDVPGKKWRELYSNARAVIFLPEKEDWGIVPFEAMAAGKPVIAVDEGGFTEAIEEGGNGFLTSGDKDEIAKNMVELAENREKASSMGKKGKETVKKYTWKKFVREIDTLVKKIA